MVTSLRLRKMAIELNYNDVQQEAAAPDQAAEPAADSGGSAISGLNSTLQEINELMSNMQQVQQKAQNMTGQGQQQQTAAPAGDMQGGVQGGQQVQTPTPNGGRSGEKQGSVLDDIDPEQVYGFLTDAVVKIEDDIGQDATMQDLEEYMVENKADIIELVQAAKSMIGNGQASQFLQGDTEDDN